MAPPTHGTTFAGLVGIGDLLAGRAATDQFLHQFGCPACSDLIVGGGAVRELRNGPVAQAGIDYTILATQADLLVTPHQTSFIREPGVHDVFVQDTCPADPVGHVGLAFDSGVARMVANALDPAHAAPVACVVGLPF
jgi:hypothetical protein